MELALLIAIVAGAFAVEATIGFGATVITVAMASLIVPIERILPAFVPLNLILSGYLVARGWRHVDKKLVVWRVLPAMALGMPIGMLAFRVLDERWLRLILGAFVTVLSLVELARKGRAAASSLPRALELALLAIAGAIHGAFASGGPVVVYVVGRRIASDKALFRATLSFLWLILNLVLAVGYLQEGKLDVSALRDSLALAPGLLLGLVAGEKIHERVSSDGFRTAVFVLLLLVGVVLSARAILAR
jgi:uncharacterized membrane protein YfcA